jgi:signal transduction histidine kinase
MGHIIQKQAETALRQALAKEQELSELKSRFVSMASHEFRTPLATILALTETVTAYRHKLTDEQIGNRLDKIKGQVGHLKDIMEDMLQLARLQARRAEFNPIKLNLDSLCLSVIDEFQSQIGFAHQLIYTCDDTLKEVRLDKKLMRHIINNLVSNAIKYSPSEKPIIINLQYVNATLILKVTDEGIGIPPDDLKHLFEPFHRAANVGTISGTGLGLVITKEAIELHGGTILVESAIGIGTTFTVNIPLKVEDEAIYDKNLGD